MATTDPFLQSALSKDATFRVRVKENLASVIGQVFAEDPATPGHAARVTYARNTLQILDAVAGQLAAFLVTRPNVVGANAALTLPANSDIPVVFTDATDAAIQSQLMSDWNFLAGA